MSKVGRNDPCPCGSGKKYKKCCAMKTPMQKLAEKITVSAPQAAPQVPGVSKLSGLFQQNVAAIPTPSQLNPENAPSLKDKVTKPGGPALQAMPTPEVKEEKEEEKQT